MPLPYPWGVSASLGWSVKTNYAMKIQPKLISQQGILPHVTRPRAIGGFGVGAWPKLTCVLTSWLQTLSWEFKEGRCCQWDRGQVEKQKDKLGGYPHHPGKSWRWLAPGWSQEKLWEVARFGAHSESGVDKTCWSIGNRVWIRERSRGDSKFSGLSNWRDGAAISWEAESWGRNRCGAGGDQKLSWRHVKFANPEVIMLSWEGPEVGTAVK